MFSKEALEDFIGLDVVIARCNTIDPEHFPEHELSLKTLRSHLDAWKQGKRQLMYI